MVNDPHDMTAWTSTAHLKALQDEAIARARTHTAAQKAQRERDEAIAAAALQRQTDHDWTPAMRDLLELCQRHRITLTVSSYDYDEDTCSPELVAHSGEYKASRIQASPKGVTWEQGGIEHEVAGI